MWIHYANSPMRRSTLVLCIKLTKFSRATYEVLGEGLWPAPAHQSLSSSSLPVFFWSIALMTRTVLSRGRVLEEGKVSHKCCLLLANKVLVPQSCQTLWEPMDCSPPGSSVLGDSPGKNTGVGCHFLLQGIFPTQTSNPGLLHYRQILYYLSHQGNPRSASELVIHTFSYLQEWPVFTGWNQMLQFLKTARCYSEPKLVTTENLQL